MKKISNVLSKNVKVKNDAVLDINDGTLLNFYNNYVITIDQNF